MEIVNYILIGGSLIFSIVTSMIVYNNEKYNLIEVSKKLKNGWGLYLVNLSRHEDNIIISPNDGEEYLYYNADIHYEEQVVTEKNSKKNKIDIKYYPGNEEKSIHNNFVINLFSKELIVNSKKININVKPNIIYDVKIDLGDNKRNNFMYETFLKEKKKYYLLMEFKNKKPVMNSISISDEHDNFKNGFYFKMFIVWFPTIMFTSSFLLL